MCMLIKRANILFDQETWRVLAGLSQQKNLSVSELIRRAVKGAYFNQAERMIQEEALEQVISLRKKTKGKTNYRQLIEDGRNY